MGSVVVDVMPVSTQVDPMGRAVSGLVPAEAFPQILEVRQGKRFVLTIDGPVTQQVLDSARQFAETALIAAGIEEIVSVREAGDATDLDDDVDDWDDMPEFWGADDTVPVAAGEHAPLKLPTHHEIDESMLGQVESGSYYGRADDVRS